MYKPIPGNDSYEINLDKNIRRIDGLECTLPIKDDKILIDLYGKKNWFCLKWLSLVAFFELSLPIDLAYNLFNVIFQDVYYTGRGKRIGKICVFAKPIYFNQTHRIVPNYPRYAISIKGNIIDVFDDTVVEIYFPVSRDQYPTVRIYCPESNRFRYVVVHRLVALAWKKRPPFPNSV